VSHNPKETSQVTTYNEISDLILDAYAAVRAAQAASESYCRRDPGREDYALVEAAYARRDEAQTAVWQALLRVCEPEKARALERYSAMAAEAVGA
jgi:hypothetical protein